MRQCRGGGVLAGAAAAQATFAARQAQIHAVSAVLTDDAPRNPLGGTGYDDGPVWALVRGRQRTDTCTPTWRR
jgi:hypothetical protein